MCLFRRIFSITRRAVALCLCAFVGPVSGSADLPIADAHVHYSHDSVELTPPARVIEIMRSANLKFALVSSSDDNGTQLLSNLAPDLIVPGLRPYRRRGELSSWFTDPAALAYVERLLQKNSYATIGEFHLYGDDVNLPIPRRIVELADKYNLVLHAHSDAAAIELLLAQNKNVKVLWAHSGFDQPDEIAMMLDKHDRLWADLAFRSEVGSGGQLSQDWIDLFTAHPDRMMLGTDTYTPERMYFIPDHAESARVWLDSLPDELAQNVAWRNAYNLLMPVWEKNRSAQQLLADSQASGQNLCSQPPSADQMLISGDPLSVRLRPLSEPMVSEPMSIEVVVCGDGAQSATVELSASMPAHGHGTNYAPEHSVVAQSTGQSIHRVDGVILHMPGNWRWAIALDSAHGKNQLTADFDLR